LFDSFTIFDLVAAEGAVLFVGFEAKDSVRLLDFLPLFVSTPSCTLA
jgi:hypothetical protein